jgi:anti-anti-sigma factor
MEIKKQQKGDAVEFQVTGRLDAYWSDHLSNEISLEIRAGIHHVRLDLQELIYVSSAGIQVLLNFYQKLKAIQGSFIVSRISDPARRVLELAGLMEFLSPADAATSVLQMPGKKLEHANAVYELFSLKESGFLRCKVLGDPSLLDGCRYDAKQAQRLILTPSIFGLGLGAFGQSYEECKNRFGEFLAVASAAAYLPTDGTNIPDYLITSGKFVPELMVLYCLLGEGSWKHLIRFEPREKEISVKLSEIVAFSFDFLKKDALALVIVCESRGLVGAALTKTPVENVSPAAPLQFPEMIDWLSFTTDRAYTRSLSLIVGIATKNQNSISILRPMDRLAQVSGHFHAAAFPYRPLKKGKIDLQETVKEIFESNRVEGVLHLIQDDREIGGIGESEFVRGAFWLSPITEIIHES